LRYEIEQFGSGIGEDIGVKDSKKAIEKGRVDRKEEGILH